MSSILNGLPFVITKIFEAYELIIVIYALLSWFPGAYQSFLGRLVIKLVSPFLNLIDKIVPPIMGISFSPVIAIFIVEAINKILLSILL